MKLLQKLEKSTEFWFLLLTSFIFFLLRLPSLYEPYWYGDEGIYDVIGMALRNGRLLYKGIWDNKPPLLYYVYALLNSDQFWVRFANLVVGLLAVIAFYYLAKKLFSKEKIVFGVTALFALLFGLPLLEGNIANSENFMLLPIILSAILVIKTNEYKIQNTKYLLLFGSGLLLGVALLFKIVSVFDFGAFMLFTLFVNSDFSLNNLFIKKFFIPLFKEAFSFSLGFIFPVLLTMIYFWAKGAFSYFISATFFSNVGYVGYGNAFIVPQGFLILKIIILGLFCLYFYTRRKFFSTTAIFIWLWFAFSVFNAFFSQRPYTHYLLVLLPSFCLLVGFYFFETKYRKTSLLILFLVTILVIKSFWLYTKFPSYYANFISFVAGQKSVHSYQAFFDSNTPTDYEIANYINLHTTKSDSIFLWGNNAQLYKLTNKLPPGRYAVAYHITNYKDGILNTENAIAIKNPKFIVVMPNVGKIPFSFVNYRKTFNINNVLIYEKVF